MLPTRISCVSNHFMVFSTSRSQTCRPSVTFARFCDQDEIQVRIASEPESTALLAREKAETLTFPQPLVWATLVRARDWWTLCEGSPQFDLTLRIHAEGNHEST